MLPGGGPVLPGDAAGSLIPHPSGGLVPYTQPSFPILKPTLPMLPPAGAIVPTIPSPNFRPVLGTPVAPPQLTGRPDLPKLPEPPKPSVPSIPNNPNMPNSNPPMPSTPVQPQQPIWPNWNLNNLPQNVQDAFNAYDKNGWKGNVPGQTPGTNAGRKWLNRYGQLPTHDANGNPITYKEFDVNSLIPGQGRDGERFVVGSDGSVYYTDSHYGDGTSLNGIPDFVQLR